MRTLPLMAILEASEAMVALEVKADLKIELSVLNYPRPSPD